MYTHSIKCNTNLQGDSVVKTSQYNTESNSRKHMYEQYILKIMAYTNTASCHKLKNGVFWNVMPCGSCKNRRFGGTLHLLHQGAKNR
jgi:hypothetical protein